MCKKGIAKCAATVSLRHYKVQRDGDDTFVFIQVINGVIRIKHAFGVITSY